MTRSSVGSDATRLIPVLWGAAVQQHAKASHVPIAPVILLHFDSGSVDPGYLVDLQCFIQFGFEKSPALENRECAFQFCQCSNEIRQRLTFVVDLLPIEPADLIILAIGVIVAVLSPSKFVAGQEHRCSLSKKKYGEHITFLPLTELNNLEVIGRTFGAAIP